MKVSEADKKSFSEKQENANTKNIREIEEIPVAELQEVAIKFVLHSCLYNKRKLHSSLKI